MKHIHWNKRTFCLSLLLLVGLLLALALPALAQTGPLPTTPQDPAAPADRKSVV